MSIKPQLGRTDLTMIVVSLVIGIGIFRAPAIVAQKAGSELIFYSAWIVGGLVSLCGALTFAEIGSRYPVAGGFYKIFSRCYNPVFAFMLNWSLVITNSFSSVAVALVGAEYIAPVILPIEMQTQAAVKVISLSMILLLFGLNYAGIRTGSKTQNILSSIKIIMILVFCSTLFFAHPAAAASTTTIVNNNSWLNVLGICLISVFFSYGGYQNTINFGEDVHQAKKNVPLGILTGISIVIALYLLINLAYVSVLGFEKVQQSKLLASELASVFFGQRGYAITSAVIFISVLGFINTALMYVPRVYYAMAGDGILPPVFKKVNSSTQVQEFALSFFTALMLIGLFWLGTFEKIINYVMVIDCFSLITAAATIFILRKQMKDTEYTGFSLKFYPVIPILFMIMLVYVIYSVFASDLDAALWGVALFIAGFPLYYLLKKFSARGNKSEIINLPDSQAGPQS